MTPVYMPFTYLSESTARLLAALVGPVVIYQPLKKNIPQSLPGLASQGLVEIRTPMTQDDDRLRSALAEFTEWARLNPGKSTPGAGFFSQQQGEIPFFDETNVNRIRSDINRYRSPDRQSDHRAEETEAEFSARLFLALAQENDLATDHLDHDLHRSKALEKDFLESLKGADEAAFNREAYGATIWQEDPGAKLTGQRIRAWATLAAADAVMPELLVTTSASVMDTLLETHGEAINLERLADIGIGLPSDGEAPVLARVLADLATRDTLPSADIASFRSLAADAATGQAVTVTLFVAANQTPATVIGRMAPSATAAPDENEKPNSARHTLFVLMDRGVQNQ